MASSARAAWEGGQGRVEGQVRSIRPPSRPSSRAGPEPRQRRIRHITAVLVRHLECPNVAGPSRLPPTLTVTPSKSTAVQRSADDSDLRPSPRRTPSFRLVGSLKGKEKATDGEATHARRRLSTATTPELALPEVDDDGLEATPTKGKGKGKRAKPGQTRRHTSVGVSSSPVKPLDLAPLPPFRPRASSIPDDDVSVTGTPPSLRPLASFVTLSRLASGSRDSRSEAAVPFYASFLDETGSTHPIFAVDDLTRSSSRLVLPSDLDDPDIEAYCAHVGAGDRVQVALWVDEGQGFRIGAAWDADMSSLVPLGRDSSAIPDVVAPTPNTLILHLGDTNGYFLLPYPPAHSSSPYLPDFPLPSPSLHRHLSPYNASFPHLVDDDDGRLEGYGSDPEGDTPLKLHLRAQQQRRSALGSTERRRREDILERSKRETRMKPAYGIEKMTRLVQMQAELRQLAEEGKRARKAVDDHCGSNRGVTSITRRHGQQADAVAVLQSDVKAGAAQVASLRDRLAHRRRTLQLRRDSLASARSLLSSERDASSSARSSLLAAQASYSSLLTSLGSRRASLVSTLSSLFPIEPVSSSPPEALLFSICSVPLPNSVYLGAAGRLDVIGVSTALGWTASAVKSLAGYLGITLLYPLSIAGSRTIVEDRVSSFLRGPRVFPLYAKGVDRHRFEYGVFLLNKDIEQIMYCRNLLALDLRHTLPNLKNLFLTTESPPSLPPPRIPSVDPVGAPSDLVADEDDEGRDGSRPTSPALTVSISRSRGSSRSEKTITLSTAPRAADPSPPNGPAHSKAGSRRNTAISLGGVATGGMNGSAAEAR